MVFSNSDTIETFFDSRMDLLERRLKKHSDKLKLRAEEAFKFKAPSGDLFAGKDIDREVQKFKLKVCLLSPVVGTTLTNLYFFRRYKDESPLLQGPGSLQRSFERARRFRSSWVSSPCSSPRSCSAWPLST